MSAGPASAQLPRPGDMIAGKYVLDRLLGQGGMGAVYLATRRAASIFGGKADGRIKNLSQVTHDIHLGALYLKFRREAPSLAAGWVGEEIFAPSREHQKLPDAILYDGQGQPRMVIEFGGAYPTERVKAFHEDCAARGLPYELW